MGMCAAGVCTEAVGDAGAGAGWKMNGGMEGVIGGSPWGVIGTIC